MTSISTLAKVWQSVIMSSVVVNVIYKIPIEYVND